ncbi:hypothetical protein NMG60_11012798 [Bertholletia excelsa]
MNREETENSRPACASCKHQRKRCDQECELVPYFPANRMDEFRAVHRVFGIANTKRMINSLNSPADKEAAVKSLIWEARLWEKDPIHGPYGRFKRLEEEFNRFRKQLNCSRPSAPLIQTVQGQGSNSHEEKRVERFNSNFPQEQSLDRERSRIDVVGGLNVPQASINHCFSQEQFRQLNVGFGRCYDVNGVYNHGGWVSNYAECNQEGEGIGIEGDELSLLTHPLLLQSPGIGDQQTHLLPGNPQFLTQNSFI